jgi:hypothetical protein
MIFCSFFILTFTGEYLFFNVHFSFDASIFLHDIFDQYFTGRTVKSFDVIVVFLHKRDYSFLVLIRKEFETTETLENAIARPAKIGFNNQPKRG